VADEDQTFVAAVWLETFEAGVVGVEGIVSFWFMVVGCARLFVDHEAPLVVKALRVFPWPVHPWAVSFSDNPILAKCVQ
jgi:hypothetical protein